MVLLSGPRQVGKTTACRTAGDIYLNWDNADHRRIILRGPTALAEAAGADHLRASPPVLVLDELHKHTKWKALRKEPKWFLRDWSTIVDPGDRAETLVGCHLLKAVEGWTDLGFGDFELRYLRDKAKREVDFLVVRDRKPWFLVEVKHHDTSVSPALAHFQVQTQAAHAFQVVMDMPFEPVDCFAAARPCVVPARTLLSQLL